MSNFPETVGSLNKLGRLGKRSYHIRMLHSLRKWIQIYRIPENFDKMTPTRQSKIPPKIEKSISPRKIEKSITPRNIEKLYKKPTIPASKIPNAEDFYSDSDTDSSSVSLRKTQNGK